MPDFGKADSLQSCSGLAYRKGNTVWLSWDMSVIGGKKFMEDVLEQYHFPADPKLVLETISRIDVPHLFIGRDIAAFIGSNSREAYVSCLWVPENPALGILSGKKSLSAITHAYTDALERFSFDDIYLEKDILKACGLKQRDIRGKTAAEIAMVAISERE